MGKILKDKCGKHWRRIEKVSEVKNEENGNTIGVQVGEPRMKINDYKGSLVEIDKHRKIHCHLENMNIL